jgi:hypothetical protein
MKTSWVISPAGSRSAVTYSGTGIPPRDESCKVLKTHRDHRLEAFHQLAFTAIAHRFYDVDCRRNDRNSNSLRNADAACHMEI